MALYYFDETGFSQTSCLPYGWSPAGQPTRMEKYSHSKRLNVLGFMSWHQKLICHTTEETVTTDTVIEAFDKLAQEKDPDKPAVVILDNASVHRSKKFRKKQLELLGRGIWLIYLPAYSPELNLIEILWRKIKYEWLPVSAYATFEALKACVKNVLSEFGQKYTIEFS
jgi:transposase